MLKRLLALTIAVVSVALIGAVASAKPLAMGDPAPGLTVKKFIKGTPVTNFEKGKLYVVEFWATWCGPCKVSIPHLTEMQKKYKDVAFIGVSVFEHAQDGVEPFVKEMGDKMDYRVAMDSIPAGKDGQSGLMAVNWMKAAEQNGIPTAFIVDKQSHIAWIGHPMAMEEPLSKVVAGTWDVKVEAARMQKQRELQAKVMSAYQMKDYTKVISLLDEAIGTDPTLEGELGYFKFTVLLLADKTADAAEYGDKLVEGSLKDNAQGLNQLAWGIVDPATPKKQEALVAMALKAALRADEISKQKDPAIADTLAAAYFAGGKTAQAIETQERALMLAKGTEFEKDPSLAQHLATYKAAAK